eukprot:g45543.t1
MILLPPPAPSRPTSKSPVLRHHLFPLAVLADIASVNVAASARSHAHRSASCLLEAAARVLLQARQLPPRSRPDEADFLIDVVVANASVTELSPE